VPGRAVEPVVQAAEALELVAGRPAFVGSSAAVRLDHQLVGIAPRADAEQPSLAAVGELAHGQSRLLRPTSHRPKRIGHALRK
jgi:hypothetical protein